MEQMLVGALLLAAAAASLWVLRPREGVPAIGSEGMATAAAVGLTAVVVAGAGFILVQFLT